MSLWAGRARTRIAELWAGATDGAHDLGHLDRVWKSCRLIALDEPGADADVLAVAAYFHDAVNLPKDSPDRARASRLSAEAQRYVGIYQLLSSMGLLTVEHLGLGIPTYDPAAYYNAVRRAPTSIQGKKLDRIMKSIGNN